MLSECRACGHPRNPVTMSKHDINSSNDLTILPIPNLCTSKPLTNLPVCLDSLTVLGQLLLCALLTALPNSPSELVGLSGIFVSRQDLGVLSALDLVVSYAFFYMNRGRTVSMKWFISVW
jgi:hypothetical protein